jgi:elongation factor P--beta-lysine ligase
MPLVLALLLTAFPSTSRTSWMRLESFHLAIGMSRDEVVKQIAVWNPKFGKDHDEIVVDYSGEKALTLEMHNDRLRSVRFELFAFLPEIRKAFDEERSHLRDTRGTARKSTKAVLIYDEALPNVMVVVTDDPRSEQGKKGIGILAVRYYDPR